eukprot:UN26690
MFEAELKDARKLVVAGMNNTIYKSSTYTTLDCFSGLWLTNITGHSLEHGMCSILNDDTGIYLGEGYLESKQNGVSIITYAQEKTLHIEGKIEKDNEPIYKNVSKLKFYGLTDKEIKRDELSNCLYVKVKYLNKRTCEYKLENASRRNYPAIILYHKSYGDLQSPTDNHFILGRNEVSAKNRRFMYNLKPGQKKKITIIETKKVDSKYHVRNL